MTQRAPFEIIPAIDLLDGQVVRLTQGDYDRITNYSYTPVELAKLYESHGAATIHVVDLDGARAGRLVNQKALSDIRNAVHCRIEFGGGVRSLETAKTLAAIGIDTMILGSLLIKDEAAARAIIHALPNQIVAGIDALGTDVRVEGWLKGSNLSVGDVIDRYRNDPLAYIIYTDVSKDGMMEGPNLVALEEVAGLSPWPVIASGGVASEDDIFKVRALWEKGVGGVHCW